jgi:hypothetical protein
MFGSESHWIAPREAPGQRRVRKADHSPATPPQLAPRPTAPAEDHSSGMTSSRPVLRQRQVGHSGENTPPDFERTAWVAGPPNGRVNAGVLPPTVDVSPPSHSAQRKRSSPAGQEPGKRVILQDGGESDRPRSDTTQMHTKTSPGLKCGRPQWSPGSYLPGSSSLTGQRERQPPCTDDPLLLVESGRSTSPFPRVWPSS